MSITDMCRCCCRERSSSRIWLCTVTSSAVVGSSAISSLGSAARAMAAIALAAEPRLLIADEPTTALDVTVQSQILELLRSLQQQRHMSVMLITHNLGIVSGYTDDLIVMYAGRIVEAAPT